jgi:predicted nucleotidyltransferase
MISLSALDSLPRLPYGGLTMTSPRTSGNREKPPDVNEQTLAETIRRFGHRPEVLVAYLFGSHARGKPTPISDIDLAVLLSEAVPRESYLDYRIALMQELTKIFRSDEVQVIILNQAPPLLAYKAVVEGKPLLCRDEVARLRFRTDATRRYLDTKPLRRIQNTATARRIREARFGHRP